jgi:hypothetical protein
MKPIDNLPQRKDEKKLLKASELSVNKTEFQPTEA